MNKNGYMNSGKLKVTVIVIGWAWSEISEALGLYIRGIRKLVIGHKSAPSQD